MLFRGAALSRRCSVRASVVKECGVWRTGAVGNGEAADRAGCDGEAAVCAS